MKITNPTNDQIVEMIEYNRKDGQATIIIYLGFEVWVYTSGFIEYEDAFRITGIDIDRLIQIMENNQAELVE